MEAIYRIKVEVIGEQTHEVSPQLLEGIECTDFVIMGFEGDKGMNTAIQASSMQIAAGIASNEDLRRLAMQGLMMRAVHQFKAGSEADGPAATSAEDEEEDG